MDKLEKAEKGTTLDVLVDCPSAIDEIPGILGSHGYKVATLQVNDGEWQIRAEK